MGRLEKPLARPGDPVSQFAAALRELRREAGNPSYRELGQRVCYSSATLSRAANGQQLPSREVALAYVRACGGQPDEWGKVWDAAQAAVGRPVDPMDRGGATEGSAATTGTPAEASEGPDADPRGRVGPLRRRPRIVTSLLVATAAPLVVIWAQFGPTPGRGAAAGPPSPSRSADGRSAGQTSVGSATTDPRTAMDGADPVQAGCASDAVTLDSRPLLSSADGQLGSVRLRYSARCSGGWAQFLPEPAMSSHLGSQVVVSIHRSADDDLNLFRYRFDGRDVYSDLLLAEPGCLEATVSIPVLVGTTGRLGVPVGSAPRSGAPSPAEISATTACTGRR